MWEGPATPHDYCRAVVARATAIEGWHQRCAAGSLLSAVVDLSQLFHPHTFLNALRQQSARALGAPMDTLKLATCWNSNRLQASAATLTAQLGGLLVQGALFDGIKLNPVDQVRAPSVPYCLHRASELLIAVCAGRVRAVLLSPYRLGSTVGVGLLPA